MESALEEIEFLALSENRVEVLDLLASGPRNRNDLASATGASQATLGRILGDFQERSWIRREGSEYVATATGRLVAAGFTDLLEILETEAELRDIVEYLPTEALEFDLTHLSDCTITTPSGTRPNAPVQRLLDLERESGEVRAFSHAFNEQSLAVVHDRTAAGDQRFQGVFSRSAIDALADDPALRERLAALLRTENASIRAFEEGVPLAATIADDVVHLLLRDEGGVLQASVDTTARPVQTWAREAFERYWEAGTPLSPEEFED